MKNIILNLKIFYKNMLENSIIHKYFVWKRMSNTINKIINKGKLNRCLKLFGKHNITDGVNIRDYLKSPDNLLMDHMNAHENILKKYYNYDIKNLIIPKYFNIRGKDFDNNNIIPVTAYRIAYYMYNINELLDNKKRNLILEIGGGFGLGALIMNRINKNNCYIIIDIPSTSIISSYFLLKMGLKVLLFDNFDKNINEYTNDYDVIILPQNFIEKINNIDVIINTASFTEMSKDDIKYYLTHLQKNTNYFYSDNHFDLNADYLYELLDNKDFFKMKLLSKKETPINYLYPNWGHSVHDNYKYEERIYKKI